MSDPPADLLDRAFVLRVPAIIKARPAEPGGRRIVEVGASTEQIDADGDVVLQEALLKSATSFVGSGHLDIDHISEFGYRMGIPDPSSYIVGRPLDVRKGPDSSTIVEGEISRALDGRVDPARNRFDEFWQSLQRDPPVVWFSSIYGWPTDLEDFSKVASYAGGPTRYLIKSLDWRSLAFTRSPKNTGITSAARIISAKSYIRELAKAHPWGIPMSMPEISKFGVCETCGVHTEPSLLGYRRHFTACKGCTPDMADVFAHALMHQTNMSRAGAFSPRKR
jgi:hypothetical protein